MIHWTKVEPINGSNLEPRNTPNLIYTSIDSRGETFEDFSATDPNKMCNDQLPVYHERNFHALLFFATLTSQITQVGKETFHANQTP